MQKRSLVHKPIQYPRETPPDFGQSIEIAPGILWIRLPLPMALDHVNIYALRDGDSWVIIDTGFHSKRGIALWQEILAGPLEGLPVSKVILTHHHPDHVGMVGWFQTHLGAELWATRTAWLYARMLTLDVQESWPEETKAFYRSAGMDPEIYRARVSDRPYNFSDVVYPMPLGFHRIVDEDVLEIGGRQWHVTCTGGHAPEHAMLWCHEDNLLIAGDQVLPTISPNIGVYPSEPLNDPLSDWLTSCERIKGMATEDYLVLPGHKLPFTGLPARIEALIANHHAALARLEAFCEIPRAAGDCFDLLFKRKIGPAEYGLALVEAIAHLNHLYLGARLSRSKDEQGVWRFAQIPT